MVLDGSNRGRGIDISVPELNSTSVLSQISVMLKLTLPLAILCRLAEPGPCMASAKHAALWCRHGISGSDFYSRARNFIAMPCTGSGILSVSSVFVLSYVIVCGCMIALRRIITICDTDGIVVLRMSMMDIISAAVICKAKGTLLTLYRSPQTERMASVGCGGSQQGSKRS